MRLDPSEAHGRARDVTLLVLDVDGVLTDGRIEIDSRGRESKRFYIRDGAAMVWAQRLGLRIGWLSGRPSDVTTRRARELGIGLVVQDGPDKQAGFDRLLEMAGVPETAVAYMGDDLLDLPVLLRARLSAAPADAVEEVLEQAHWVSAHAGGRGAVRELIELLLRASERWHQVMEMFRPR